MKLIATTYQTPYRDIRIESRLLKDGEVTSWAVIDCGSVLNTEGEWEHESSPSNRDEAFLARARFPSVEAATKALEAWFEKHPNDRERAMRIFAERYS